MHNFKSRIDHANMTIFFGGVVRMSTHEYVFAFLGLYDQYLRSSNSRGVGTVEALVGSSNSRGVVTVEALMDDCLSFRTTIRKCLNPMRTAMGGGGVYTI
jgi:hypothetical protein